MEQLPIIIWDKLLSILSDTHFNLKQTANVLRDKRKRDIYNKYEEVGFKEFDDQEDSNYSSKTFCCDSNVTFAEFFRSCDNEMGFDNNGFFFGLMAQNSKINSHHNHPMYIIYQNSIER